MSFIPPSAVIVIGWVNGKQIYGRLYLLKPLAKSAAEETAALAAQLLYGEYPAAVAAAAE